VWTFNEAAAKAARVRAAQAAAKAQTEAEMEARITAIVSDATLTPQQKRTRLRQLPPSGYSNRE